MKRFIQRYDSWFLLGAIVTLFISCNNDFIEVNTDLVNEEVATNFALDSIEYEVLAYTLPLGPVQSNNLVLNHIGIFNDPTYGISNYSYVSQIGLDIYDPDFGENAVIDSVMLYIPYYSTNEGAGEDGETEYVVDSIYGDAPIRLDIFESEYFLRDFNPDGDFGEQQRYYSNKSASETEDIPDEVLEGPEILVNETIQPSAEPVFFREITGDTLELGPGLYAKLDSLYWTQKIIDKQGSSDLASESAFRNYFRGLYFKTESIDNDGSLIGLNLGNSLSNVTIYYKNDSSFEEENLNEDDEPRQFTARINFGGNQVNFIENDFAEDIQIGDQENGDASLYLKGGEGSLAGIELFPGVTETGESQLEAFRNTFGEYDEDGEFIAYKRLINEANLVLYVDQAEVLGNREPERLYLYNLDDARPLIDYAIDALVAAVPRLSKSSHLGILQREGDDPDGRGVRYTMKITSHLLNIIETDSSNVKLGLAVASNINLEAELTQGDVQPIEDSAELVPLSSITSPRGTVIQGNRSNNPEERLRLKIFYTCLEDIEDCSSEN